MAHAVVIIPEVARGILCSGDCQGRPVPRAVVGMVELEVRCHPVRAFLALDAVQPVECYEMSAAYSPNAKIIIMSKIYNHEYFLKFLSLSIAPIKCINANPESNCHERIYGYSFPR